jgi:hypothetical protein
MTACCGEGWRMVHRTLEILWMDTFPTRRLTAWVGSGQLKVNIGKGCARNSRADRTVFTPEAGPRVTAWWMMGLFRRVERRLPMLLAHRHRLIHLRGHAATDENCRHD